jgi:hypothetical protein
VNAHFSELPGSAQNMPLSLKHPVNGMARNGRGERIRTSDTLLPKQVLYQAELHPDPAKSSISSRFIKARRNCNRRFDDYSGGAESIGFGIYAKHDSIPPHGIALQKGPRQADFYRFPAAFFICDSFRPSLCSGLGNHP